MLSAIMGGGILALLTSTYLPLRKYSSVPVHVSIDDVELCMKDVASNESSYSSIFHQPFFGELRELHDDFGARFTLYIYAESTDFQIEDVPAKYRNELSANADWLQFGFHAIRPSFSKTETSNLDSFSSAFQRVSQAIERFAGDGSKSSCLRLHYYYATPEERAFLANNGVKMLLTADNPGRESYSLSRHDSSFSDSAMRYLATDMRVENMGPFPFIDLARHDECDTLVLFTHEWALDSKMARLKFRRILHLLTNSNAIFIN